VASSAVLYTPQVLALAAGLAAYPLTADLTLRGAARAPTCGSTLDLGLALDPAGAITAIGLRAHACAIGQAAAAIFAGAAPGLTRARIAAAEAAIGRWLAGDGDLPAWPGLEAIAAARDYPARHGAVLLAWRAALDALPSA
jgi:NifU-like protein involved in Fe-S cluster formation